MTNRTRFSGPDALALDRAGRFRYAANPDDSITAYTIGGATGALTEIAGSPFHTPMSGGEGRQSLTTDPTDRFLYLTNDDDAVVAFAIDQATGVLTLLGSFATGAIPAAVTVDPTDRFLYAGNLGSDNVSAFTIDATSGALTTTGLVRTRLGSLARTQQRHRAGYRHAEIRLCGHPLW